MLSVNDLSGVLISNVKKMLPVNDLSGVLISNVKKIQASTLTFVRWSGTSEN